MTPAPFTPAAAAATYLRRGLRPLPLPPRSKRPIIRDWPAFRADPERLTAQFPADGNLGLVLGDGLVVIDLDSAEALAAAPVLLPGTNMIGGRGGQRAHWFFRAEWSGEAKFSDPAHEVGDDHHEHGPLLLEVLGDGRQVVVAPSVHPSGESYALFRDGEPATVDAEELRTAVQTLAAAALLARRFPAKGSQHNARLALAGGLARAGWSAERVVVFLRAVCLAMGFADNHETLGWCRNAAATVERQEGDRATTGWPTLAELLGAEGERIVRQVQAWLGADLISHLSQLRTPGRENPEPEPLATEAFHGLAGEIVRAIDPHTEADPAAVLVSLLAGFGNFAGRGVWFAIGAERHHGNLYAVVVGKTANARKGTSWNAAKALLAAAEATIPGDGFDAAPMERWIDRTGTGLSSGEGVIHAVRDPVVTRERIKDKGAVTYQDVESDPGVSDKRLLVVETEFAGVLKQTERQGNTLSVVLRNGWDGTKLRTMTRNNGLTATDAHVSLLGHITTEELRRCLTATESANGFANRMLWIHAKRSKALPNPGWLAADAQLDLAFRLGEALAFARTAGAMARDPEAEAVWCGGVYQELTREIPGLRGALLARGAAHVVRLSMVYALLDRCAAVGLPHLLAAVAVWRYAEQSVGHIFGDLTGDPLADELLAAVRTSANGLTRTELQALTGRHHSKDRLGQALGVLFRAGLAWFRQETTGGRPSERWFAGKGAADA